MGAGPYGLAVAAHLIDQGVSVRVFGEAMASWRRNMPDGMFLKSTPSASNISTPRRGYTLADFCRLHGLPELGEDDPIPVDVFRNYGVWFQQNLVPIEHEWVTNVTRYAGRFDVTLASGEVITTPHVIVAAGHVQFAELPRTLRPLALGDPLPTDHLSHISNHSDLSHFAGREVALIGGGQSALESAALLHEAGAGVHLLVRSKRIVWGNPPDGHEPKKWEFLLKPPSPLGEGWSHYGSCHWAPMIRFLPPKARLEILRLVLGPSGSWWLRDRVDRKVDIRTDRQVAKATLQGDKAVLDLVDHRGSLDETLVVDHVVAATGYRVDVDSIEFLESALRARIRRVDGFPVLDGAFSSSVPGLHFVGLPAAASFGPMLRFVCGTEFAAPRLARAIARGR